jgi:hypothetical protein
LTAYPLLFAISQMPHETSNGMFPIDKPKSRLAQQLLIAVTLLYVCMNSQRPIRNLPLN